VQLEMQANSQTPAGKSLTRADKLQATCSDRFSNFGVNTSFNRLLWARQPDWLGLRHVNLRSSHLVMMQAESPMPSEKKYSLWPATIIICLAFVAPVTIGTIEVRTARNSHAETSAMQHLQAIAKAEVAYQQSHGEYPTTLDALNGLPAADPYYRYDYRKISASAYTITAAPREPGKHGKRFFYMDQAGVVRYELLRPATATSPEAPLPKDAKTSR
jgi:hypothetical protein